MTDAVQQRIADPLFQGTNKLPHGGGRDAQLFCRTGKAAGFHDCHKDFQTLHIQHGLA